MYEPTGWDAVAAYLRTNQGADVLDDAVRGALDVDDVDELLEDFGLAPGEFHRRMFWRELNAALADEHAAA